VVLFTQNFQEVCDLSWRT